MSQADIVVLGAGLVGATIARDLSSRGPVLVVDADAKALKRVEGNGIETLKADLGTEGTLAGIVSGRRLAVGAVPGWLGLRVFESCIEAGTDIVDISFFPEDPLPLAKLARERGVRAIMDAGVAPGLCNIWLGDVLSRESVHRYDCVVGGLPFERTPPWAYKAPFSPVDVIEEYTRPARHKEAGTIVTRPALGNPELIEFDVGTLEAFDTDGLRTLLTTVDIPDLRERTLRWPGHRAKAQLLRDSGFFDTEALHIAGGKVTPLTMTAKLLLNQWKLQPEDREFTVMRVEIESDSGTAVYDLFDETADDGTSSMARTTGYTCTAVAQLVLDDAWTEHGVFAPEHVGLGGHLPAVETYLGERGVTWTVSSR